MDSESMKLDSTDVKKVSKEAIWGFVAGAVAILANAIVQDPGLSDKFGNLIKSAMPVGFGAVGVKLVFYFLKRFIKNNNIE